MLLVLVHPLVYVQEKLLSIIRLNDRHVLNYLTVSIVELPIRMVDPYFNDHRGHEFAACLRKLPIFFLRLLALLEELINSRMD